MDKDNLFKALLYAAVAFLIWNFIARLMAPPPQQPVVEQSLSTPVATAESTPGATVEGQATAEETFVDLGSVESADPSTAADDYRDYRVHLKLSSRGAGIVSAWLTDFSQTVHGKERYELLRPVEVGDRSYYSLATDSVKLQAPGNSAADDVVFQLQQANWQVESHRGADGQRATFTAVLARDGVPQVRVTKTFFLTRQAPDERHSDLQLTMAFDNLTSQPIEIIMTQGGPIGIRQEDPRTDYRRVSACVFKSGRLELNAEQPAKLDAPADLLDGKDNGTQMQWVALANKFFAVIVAPLPAADTPWVGYTMARRLVYGAEKDIDDATFSVETGALQIEPNARVERSFDCYLGPKSKKTFSEVEPYAGRNYVALINADYYMCAWTWIVNLMLWLLDTVHGVWPHNYGLAIIVMVLVVRFILHPLTKKGQVNMARMAEQMQALQPKMEELRRKYEGDRQRINQETMKLYQAEGVNPAGQMFGCLPMFCQLPIWAALWAALQTTVELRHEAFILWINDLTAPDHLIQFSSSLPLVGQWFNLLPLLLGLSMWLQNKYMPKPASATQSTTQAAQQKVMMSMMSVMMVVFFYNAPSGLTLYIMASNFFGLFEQWRIRTHIAEEKARHAAAGTKPRFEKPRWIQKLERLAEDAREQQQLQQKKKSDHKKKPDQKKKRKP